jgi:hypothetical protein
MARADTQHPVLPREALRMPSCGDLAEPVEHPAHIAFARVATRANAVTEAVVQALALDPDARVDDRPQGRQRPRARKPAV